MKCSKCNRDLQPGDELKWECSSCHQFCRANLQMLEQIQTQRENGYTAAMVNCPFCGTVLDDGNEKIHWDCLACGNRITGTIKNYVRPEMFVEKPEPEQDDSANQSEFAWFDSNGEAMDAPPEEAPSKQKSFFANEEEKNEFLAETRSQALGEEIPDSIFEDVPIRKPKKTSVEPPEQKAVSTSGAASPFVEPPAEPGKPVASALPPTTALPAGDQTGTASPGNAPQGSSRPAASVPGTAPQGSSRPAASVPGTAPQGSSRPAASVPGNTPQGSSRPVAPSSDVTSLGGGMSQGAVSDNIDPSENTTGSTVSDSSTPELSHYEPSEPASKQVLPKILTGILSVVIVAAILVGVFFIVQFFMAPTRQFRSAVQAADYVKASEIYDNKIKGDTEDEKVAKIAVEHFLHERYDAFKNGTGDEAAYQKILKFAQNEMGMDTSDYEPGNEPEETPEPTETPEPAESPVVEETDAPSETPGETAEPEVTPEPTPEVTAEPEATPESTFEPAEEPAGDTQPSGTEDEITAAIQKANNYVKKKKYEKAYNHLAKYKDSDTTGQIKKEMSSIKKDWKSYNITTFKTLCGKLAIVYYASEKRYHIVPKGYYTNYNQISRSNNVGGIAYMDQQKKKVSITNIGKDGTLSSFGKTNRANLKQFKEMIEKYPYLAKEIK